MKKVNCIYHEHDECTCEKVKKSFFSFGARLCSLFNKNIDDKICEYYKERPNPFGDQSLPWPKRHVKYLGKKYKRLNFKGNEK